MTIFVLNSKAEKYKMRYGDSKIWDSKILKLHQKTLRESSSLYHISWFLTMPYENNRKPLWFSNAHRGHNKWTVAWNGIKTSNSKNNLDLRGVVKSSASVCILIFTFTIVGDSEARCSFFRKYLASKCYY